MMRVSLAFPANPTAEDIFRARIFEEPLVPMGAEPTPGENADFAAALAGYADGGGPDDFSALTAFPRRSPALPVERGIADQPRPGLLQERLLLPGPAGMGRRLRGRDDGDGPGAEAAGGSRGR